MMEPKVIADAFYKLFRQSPRKIDALPRSGSDRKYYRILSEGKNMIAAFNPVIEENEAFVGFTKHFRMAGLPVPEIYGYQPDKHVYFLQDLGDTNLFTWLAGRSVNLLPDDETLSIYKKVLDNLVVFQTKGIEGLDLDLCYPHRSFDRQSMMWDMNYFKYMFLKLMAVPFNEKHLEHDFLELSDHLLEAGQDYFLYRDFQTANIMIMGDKPWFIDYQGGRRGAPQYDLASLLYDAKVRLPEITRDQLKKYFVERFCQVTKQTREEFNAFYPGFCMIRLIQALGTFGFRGLYENKPTFTESIVPGVENLLLILSSVGEHIKLPELYKTIRSVQDTAKFRELASAKQ